jgi:hypothetical protein
MSFDPTAGKGVSRTPAVLKFRKIFYRVLMIWYLSLDYWAGRWLPQLKGSKTDLASRRIFSERNKAWQEEMGQVFSHCHPICRDCRHCCMIDLPLYQVDCVLYGFLPQPALMVPPLDFHGLAAEAFPWLTPAGLQQLRRSWRGQGQARNRQEKFVRRQNPTPCWMWTQSGCKYPYGRRPTFCVLYLCDGLLLQMSWFDFRRYVWVSGKYLARLTRSMRAIFLEWQQKQRHTTTGIR